MRPFIYAALICVLSVTTASATLIVDFSSTVPDGGGSGLGNPVTLAGATPADEIPAVITIDIDGVGNVSASSITSNRPAVTDNWGVSGTVSTGFNSTVVLTLTGRVQQSSGSFNRAPIRQINLGGIGVAGGNSGRIDRNLSTGVTEFLNVDVDATDGALSGQNLELRSIGYTNANAVATIDPDLVLDQFGGGQLVFNDLVNVATSPLSVSAGSTVLSGGSTGLLRFSQGEVKDSQFVGYSLASLEFDLVAIPEPSSCVMLALAMCGSLATRARVRRP